jgi:hypothetical protein
MGFKLLLSDSCGCWVIGEGMLLWNLQTVGDTLLLVRENDYSRLDMPMPVRVIVYPGFLAVLHKGLLREVLSRRSLADRP